MDERYILKKIKQRTGIIFKPILTCNKSCNLLFYLQGRAWNNNESTGNLQLHKRLMHLGNYFYLEIKPGYAMLGKTVT